MPSKMLRIRAKQLNVFNEHARYKFARGLRTDLAEKYPSIFGSFSMHAQEQMVTNLLGRADRWGITWQSAYLAFAEMMLSIAPNFDDLPEVQKLLCLEWLTPNRAVLSMDRQLIKKSWQAAGILTHDLPLFVPPQSARSSLLNQTAAAIPIVLEDKIGDVQPLALATSALATAQSLRLDTVQDAGLVIAAGSLLYGGRFHDRSAFLWMTDKSDHQCSPAQTVAMLKAQIRSDHGRFI